VESRAAKTIREIFESGRPLTYIRSSEEQRIARILKEVSQNLRGSSPLPIWTWSLTEGMRGDGEASPVAATDPRGLLDFIIAHPGAAIFHLKDFHEPLRESSEIRRRLRDVYESCLDQRKFVVITSPVRFVPEEVERSILFLELRTPDVVELLEFLREETPATSDEILQQVAGAPCSGLTLDEARYAVAPRAGQRDCARALSHCRRLLEEKRLLVNRSGVHRIYCGRHQARRVGGLEASRNGCWNAANCFRCATA
jgi:hypothetical protein